MVVLELFQQLHQSWTMEASNVLATSFHSVLRLLAVPNPIKVEIQVQVVVVVESCFVVVRVSGVGEKYFVVFHRPWNLKVLSVLAMILRRVERLLTILKPTEADFRKEVLKVGGNGFAKVRDQSMMPVLVKVDV